MMRLGFRLALTGPRAKFIAVARVVGVAVSTAILLFALAMIPSGSARDERAAWMDAIGQMPPVEAEPTEPSTWFWKSNDHIGSKAVSIATVAPATGDAPVPPGIPALPADDEAYVSPALAELLETTPLAAGRYGDVVGVIGDEALSSPDALVAIRGISEPDVVQAMLVTAFESGFDSGEIEAQVALLVVIGAVAVLVPTVLFVASTTRLAAASRDRRLAALRLAGADPSQVCLIALAESLVAGVGGVLLGIGLFFLVRPFAARIEFDGDTWFAADLQPGVPALLAVVLLVPLMVALAASMPLRRVLRSPLGVSRKAPAKPLHWWRLLPAALALATLVLVQLSAVMRSLIGGSDDRVVGVSFALILASVVLAGPWITRLLGVLLARRSNVAAVLAGRRLADDPRAGFRAVAGIVLAVLAVSALVTMTPAAAESIEDTRVTAIEHGTGQADVGTLAAAEAEQLTHAVRDQAGIEATALAYTAGVSNTSERAWLGSCTEIVRAAGWSDIPCGTASVLAVPDLIGQLHDAGELEVYDLQPAQIVPPFGPRIDLPSSTILSLDGVAEMPARRGVDVPAVLVDTDLAPEAVRQFRPDLLAVNYTNTGALEQARTIIVRRVPTSTLETRQSTFDGYSADVRNLYDTATVVTAVVVAVAAISLVISVAVGLLERRLPFALLRATGTPLRTLRLTMFLEAAIPLVFLTVIAVLLGHLVGLWTAASTESTASPTFGELAQPSALALAAALAVIVSALPLVKSVTATEQVRFD